MLTKVGLKIEKTLVYVGYILEAKSLHAWINPYDNQHKSKANWEKSQTQNEGKKVQQYMLFIYYHITYKYGESQKEIPLFENSHYKTAFAFPQGYNFCKPLCWYSLTIA